jgi:trafficking protein particle complex subunit 13
LVWNSPATSLFQPIEYGDLRLSVVEANSTVKIGEPFKFTCRVTNTSDVSMDLLLNLNTSPKVDGGYTGSTEFFLGNLEPGKLKDFHLTVCPVKLGLITVSNLQLTDAFKKRTYEFEDFVQVFVVDADYKEEEPQNLEKFIRYTVQQ